MRAGRKVATAVVTAFVVAVGGMMLARALGYRLGLDTPVRCRRGHLFTTTWIPGIKLKALDLGIARVQWCPVGRHVSLVVPIKPSSLSPEDEVLVGARHDVPIP